MRPHLIALAAALATCAVAAAPTDPLHAAGCVSAMRGLHDAQEALAAAARPGNVPGPASSAALARLAAIRREAARTCLGGDGSLRRAPEVAIHAPVSAMPPVPQAPMGPRPAANTAPAPVSAPLKSIMTCDAVGCWVNDGTRVQKVGPGLLGPTGFCTVQGPVLHCP